MVYHLLFFSAQWTTRQKNLHCRGVRQGDPLSHLLFILAMEPLHRLIKKAQDMGLLPMLSKGCQEYRVSMYADDAAIFIRPTEQDLNTIKCALKIFEEASGLTINMAKTEVYPIQCDQIDLSFLTESNLAISTFPCKYLGLPLHFRKPARQMMQPIVQKIGNKLPGWKRNFLSYPG
jgi:hypothetical protein